MKSSSKTYYVSQTRGSDRNDGLSESTAFATLHQINKLHLMPGDSVLLERGSVFENQYLHITDSGDENAPITIAAFGEGELPVIAAQGQGIWYQDYGCELDSRTHTYRGYVSSAVLLYDAEYIRLEDIEITNEGGHMAESYSQGDRMCRTGVAVVAKNKGTRHSLHLSGLYIHDVYGNVYDKHMNNGGIYMTALQPDDEAQTGVARYEDVSIVGCFLQRVSRWGIAVGYTYAHEHFTGRQLDDRLFYRYGHIDIEICDNYVKEIGGDGITVMYCLEPQVHHNMADTVALDMNDRVYTHAGDRGGKLAAGIWPWKCKGAEFSYNEVVDTRLNQDGMAYDADSGDGTIYEGNYSRCNEGGCIMFCMDECVNSIFRENVSHDDLTAIITAAGNPLAYVGFNEFTYRRSLPLIREYEDEGELELEDNELVDL